MWNQLKEDKFDNQWGEFEFGMFGTSCDDSGNEVFQYWSAELKARDLAYETCFNTCSPPDSKRIAIVVTSNWAFFKWLRGDGFKTNLKYVSKGQGLFR